MMTIVSILVITNIATVFMLVACRNTIKDQNNELHYCYKKMNEHGI